MSPISSWLVEAPAGGFLANAVEVQWDPASVKLSHAATDRMKTVWNDCLRQAEAEGRTLFDGAITRLIEARLDHSGTTPTVVLRVGPGSYQAFVVTRLQDRSWFETHAPEAVTLALGNSVLLTNGSRVLLGVRGRNVSAYAGRLHQFGGVVEALNTREFPANVEGLIAHLLVELREELNLDPRDLAPRYPLPHLAPAWPRLLGIFYDHALGQPELIWQWETNVPLSHIAQQIDKAEHDGHVILERSDVESKAPENLTPLAREAIAAWSRQ